MHMPDVQKISEKIKTEAGDIPPASVPNTTNCEPKVLSNYLPTPLRIVKQSLNALAIPTALLLQGFLHRNGYCHGGSHHGVVAHSDESHHFNVSGD